MDNTSGRLDNFVDAAFAFAVTVLITRGSGAAPSDAALLTQTVASLPSFAIGYAIIGMFWYAHVRWQRLLGAGGGVSILLTFLLVFFALTYVFPLGAMASSLTAAVVGRPGAGLPSLGVLFTIYGAGFLAMSATVAALFGDALTHYPRGDPARHAVLGELIIWLVLTATAVVSTGLAAAGGTAALAAPWVYATLPVTVGMFAARWRWEAEPPR